METGEKSKLLLKDCKQCSGQVGGPEHSPGEGWVCVEHGLAGHPLQQRQAPLPPLLDHPRLLAVEILGREVLGEHAVQVQLLVHQGQLLVQLLELGEPAHALFRAAINNVSFYLFQIVTVLASSGELRGKVVQVTLYRV